MTDTVAATTGASTARAMAGSQALVEAHRCLMCWDAPCIRACPTSIDVPGFIKRIAHGDDFGAAKLILSANILGYTCAHACPTEVLCEGACVLNDVDARPVAIGALQGYATEPVVESGLVVLDPLPATGFRVAVVGAGPAGLSCAAELINLGHDAEVFDRDAEPGGLVTHGVASYKVTHDAALVEVSWLKDQGIEVTTGTVIGRDISVDDLLSEFDAVFLGVGLGDIAPLNLSGEDLEGVLDALEVIAAAKRGDVDGSTFATKHVLVVGGGNTAIDAARLAVRLGAESVTVVYRRGADHMPAYHHEVAEARLEGVEFEHWAAPAEVLGDQRVEALRCRRTEPGEMGDDGRPAVVTTAETVELGADIVIRSTGQAPRASLFELIPGLETDRGGRVVVDAGYHTSHPKVWAGGDCVNGGKEVVNAVAEGKAAAIDIDAVLRR